PISADAVHVPTDDVHLVRVLRTNFHTNHFLSLARRSRLQVDRADRWVGLRERVVGAAALAHVAEDAASARTVAWGAAPVRRSDRGPSASAASTCRWCRRVLVSNPLDILASVLFELRLDPV